MTGWVAVVVAVMVPAAGFSVVAAGLWRVTNGRAIR